jgi:hypothetical protein
VPAARLLPSKKINPLDSRRTDLTVPTFGEAADELIAAMAPSWRNAKHLDQWAFTLGRRRDDHGKLNDEGNCLRLRNRWVDKIDIEDVLAAYIRNALLQRPDAVTSSGFLGETQ